MTRQVLAAEETSIATWIALGIAIYGAVVATVTVCLGLLARGDRLQVHIRSPEGKRLRTVPEHHPFVEVSLVNRSDHVIYVARAEIRYPPIGAFRSWPLSGFDTSTDVPIDPRARKVLRLERAYFEEIRSALVFPVGDPPRPTLRERLRGKTLTEEFNEWAAAAENWKQPARRFRMSGIPATLVVRLSTGKEISCPSNRLSVSGHGTAPKPTDYTPFIRFWGS